MSSSSPPDRYRSSWEHRQSECRVRTSAEQSTASHHRQLIPGLSTQAARSPVWFRPVAPSAAVAIHRGLLWPRICLDSLCPELSRLAPAVQRADRLQELSSAASLPAVPRNRQRFRSFSSRGASPPSPLPE